MAIKERIIPFNTLEAVFIVSQTMYFCFLLPLHHAQTNNSCAVLKRERGGEAALFKLPTLGLNLHNKNAGISRFLKRSSARQNLKFELWFRFSCFKREGRRWSDQLYRVVYFTFGDFWISFESRRSLIKIWEKSMERVRKVESIEWNFASAFSSPLNFQRRKKEEKGEERRGYAKLNSDRGEKRAARDTHRFPLISFEAIALNPIDLGGMAG